MDMHHLLPWLLAYGHLVIIASAAIAFGLTAGRKNLNMTDADELRRRGKQKQGGHIFNEMLREMRVRNNRMIDGAIKRLSKSNLDEGERTLCAEIMSMCRNEIEDIDHLLDMKEPD